MGLATWIKEQKQKGKKSLLRIINPCLPSKDTRTLTCGKAREREICPQSGLPVSCALSLFPKLMYVLFVMIRWVGSIECVVCMLIYESELTLCLRGCIHDFSQYIRLSHDTYTYHLIQLISSTWKTVENSESCTEYHTISSTSTTVLLAADGLFGALRY